MNALDVESLQAGDLVTWVCLPADQDHLGEWFSSGSAELRAFYGDFTVRGDIAVSDMAMAYGLVKQAAAAEGANLNDLFQQAHKNAPVVGDTLWLGPLRLRARAMRGGKVTLVGVKLPD